MGIRLIQEYFIIYDLIFIIINHPKFRLRDINKLDSHR
jgi:hypothetical protein